MQVKRQKLKSMLFAVPLFLFTLLFGLTISRRPVGDYSDPEIPFYEGYYADSQGSYDGKLLVVAWNLHYAEKLDQAISTLENVPELQDADVLLLQEIDLEGMGAFYQNAKSGLGHLQLLPVERLNTQMNYGRIWDDVIDPYRGPDPDK